MACDRVTYRNRKQAQEALQRILRARRRQAEIGMAAYALKHERHAYRCDRCNKWHLTSGGLG
jgi:hypothetical protein